MLRPHPAFAFPLAVLLSFTLRPEPEPGPVTFAPQLTIVANSTPAPAQPPIVVAPPAPAAADRPSCPPPRTDAPFVTPKLDEPIDHVQPAPSNAGWIAAWNDSHVFASYDAGVTFSRVLDGMGHVRDASFDCWGHLVVLRDGKLGVRDGTSESWHSAPGLNLGDDTPGAVLGGGPDIVVIARAAQSSFMRAAISADSGASWRYHDLHDGSDAERIQGRQRSDGSIDVAYAIGDCMNDDLVSARIVHGEVQTDFDGLAEGSPFGVYDGVVLDDSRWRARDGAWQDYPFQLAARPIPGPYPVLVAGDKTYRLADGKLRELPLVVEGQPQAVDPAGRIWTVACGVPLVAKRTATGLTSRCEAGD